MLSIKSLVKERVKGKEQILYNIVIKARDSNPISVKNLPCQTFQISRSVELPKIDRAIFTEELPGHLNEEFFWLWAYKDGIGYIGMIKGNIHQGLLRIANMGLLFAIKGLKSPVYCKVRLGQLKYRKICKLEENP